MRPSSPLSRVPPSRHAHPPSAENTAPPPPPPAGEQLLGAFVYLKLSEGLQTLRSRGQLPDELDCTELLKVVKAEVRAGLGPPGPGRMPRWPRGPARRAGRGEGGS